MVEAIQLQFLLATFAAWVSRRQSQLIAYLIEENRVLKPRRPPKLPHLWPPQTPPLSDPS